MEITGLILIQNVTKIKLNNNALEKFKRNKLNPFFLDITSNDEHV